MSRTDVYWGTRVIVPPQLRSNVVDEIHDGHPGCKSFARGYVLWPGIDGDSKQCVRQCLLCQRNHKAPKGPVKSWEWSEKPWTRLHIDHSVEGTPGGECRSIIRDNGLWQPMYREM